eukprot:365940-Chlamydomonas_euryale.AAC.32
MSNPSHAAALRLNTLTSPGILRSPTGISPHPHTPCRNGPDFTAQPPTKVSARHSSRHAPVNCAVKYVYPLRYAPYNHLFLVFLLNWRTS